MYDLVEFYALLSRAWKKFYSLGIWFDPAQFITHGLRIRNFSISRLSSDLGWNKKKKAMMAQLFTWVSLSICSLSVEVKNALGSFGTG